MNNGRLQELSQDMTETGDRWRDFAAIAGRIIKNRSGESESYALMSEKIAEIADREHSLFSELKKAVR